MQHDKFAVAPRGPSTPPARRAFLRICGAGAATCALGCSNSSSVEPGAFGDVVAGNVSSLPVGTLQLVGSAPVFIARDAAGFYAVTATCTHQGCEVRAQTSGSSAALVCPCHGSRFDSNGAVLNGPATSPLVHFAVEIDTAGSVTIHGGTRVDAATRVVPM